MRSATWRVASNYNLLMDKHAQDFARQIVTRLDDIRQSVHGALVRTRDEPKNQTRIKKCRSFLENNRVFTEVLGLIVLAVYTAYTIKMYSANKQAAEAATNAASTARDALVATNRPWVSFDMRAVSPLTFDKDGAHLSFDVTFKNTGGSTAISTGFKVEMWRDITPTIPNGVVRERERLCKEAAQLSVLSKALFVGDPRTDTWLIGYPPEGVSTSVKQSGDFSALIIACIEYRSPVSDRFFETASVISLGRQKYIDPRGRPSFSIIPPDSVPISSLSLAQDPTLGLSVN